jgi:hypothetical protein
MWKRDKRRNPKVCAWVTQQWVVLLLDRKDLGAEGDSAKAKEGLKLLHDF